MFELKIADRLAPLGLRTALVIIVMATLCAVTSAQAPPPKASTDLARLPEAIKTLPWRTIDLNSVNTLERCRALLIMNHVLSELGPVRASDADLMSTYIDEKNLGADLAGSGQPSTTVPLTYTDGLKIAVAILRGPLANSSYAKQLNDSLPSTLASYQQMYDSTCQRRWAEVAESTQELRYMSAFLKEAGKFEDYQTWAKQEAENRRLKYQQTLAQKQDAAKTAQAEQAAQRQAAAQAAAQQQQAQTQQENEQLRQALSAAQYQQENQQPVQSAASDDYYGYPGWFGTPYYGGVNTWYSDAAYVGVARANTEARMATWRGNAARRR